MKKLIVTLIATASLGGASTYAQSCKDSSWNPELYSFYGEKAQILKKLANISTTKLADRRVFLQVTQGDSSADVKLYERQEDGKFTVTEWTTKQTARLLADIDEAIVANTGVNCVGEQVKGILGKELKEGKVSEQVAAPASPKAAFAHPVDQAVGEFIKTVIILLC
jgi:hypothetical protein